MSPGERDISGSLVTTVTRDVLLYVFVRICFGEANTVVDSSRQNLFKIHPLFDSVFEGILHVDKRAHIILQAVPNRNKLDLFSKRLLNSFAMQVCARIGLDDDRDPCEAAKEVSELNNNYSGVSYRVLRGVYPSCH